nr:immunoglobulin heavy chain junction region [Macaca mulatta]
CVRDGYGRGLDAW